MKFGILILSTVFLFSCFSTTEPKQVNTFADLDVRDLRMTVLVEAPAKLHAQESKLTVTVNNGNTSDSESFTVKLLGVAMTEDSDGFFSFDIVYNSHLIAVDDSQYEAFKSFQDRYPMADFSFEMSPKFINLPNKPQMYYGSSVRTTLLGEFVPLREHILIDVPR